ncbi:MAG: SIMPL domain-containing protein [archaeon]
MSENKWILPVSLIVAALIVVAGIGFVAMNLGPAEQGPVTVQLPGYMQKSSNAQSEGAPASFDDGVLSFAEDESGNKIRLISVSGTITKTASPELAYVTLSIQTLDKSASKSQSDNAVLAAKVMEALKNAGLDEKDIETASYSVYEEFQWNENTRKSESLGYRTTNSIQATVRDLSKVGGVIDVAVQAGANSISGVSFALTKETEAELRTLALQEASANARAKAQSIATGLGISVGTVYSASENSSYATPYYAKSYAMDAAGEAASAPTPISPGDIEFNATVSVQFEIQ